MRRIFITSMILTFLVFGLSSAAKADSFTAGGLVYTFTNLGSDGSGGFLVNLAIDATSPSASGTLSLFSVQFADNGTNATNASLVGTTNATNWSVAGFGNTNHCGTGNLPFICSQGDPITITSGVNSGIFTFTFDVTGLPGLPNAGDVQAFQGQGDLAISQGIGIGVSATPEPATLALLGLGLIGVPFFRRKK